MMCVQPARTKEKNDVQCAEGKGVMTLETIGNKEAKNTAGMNP